MACRSASVQRAEEKFGGALEAINKLIEKNEKFSQKEEDYFLEQIEKSQNSMGVDDFENVGVKQFATKVEFTSEFNADALVAVISEVLNTAAVIATAGGSAAAIFANPDNIKTFSNLLTAIAESIKTKSTTAANIFYSMNRIAPGLYACTLSKAMTITDKETFGEEAITATTFHYALFFSKQHAQKITHWDRILSLLMSIRKLNEARVNLVDQLVDNKITIAVFNNLSGEFKKAINEYEDEMSSLVGDMSTVEITNKANEEIVLDINMNEIVDNQSKCVKSLYKSIELLDGRSSIFEAPLLEAKELLDKLK
ncbi:MAG: hypothetical protein AAF901_04290 [Bacteroidota bacterium]